MNARSAAWPLALLFAGLIVCASLYPFTGWRLQGVAPLALLYPVSVPFGLGQVAERLDAGLHRLLAGTPFLDWLPLRPVAPPPLSPLGKAFCVALGLLAPLILGFADLRTGTRRAIFGALLFAVALGVAGLSSALTYGPHHAWAWLSPPAVLGLGLAALVGLSMRRLPWRLCTWACCCAWRWRSACSTGRRPARTSPSHWRSGSRAVSSAFTASRSGWAGSGRSRR